MSQFDPQTPFESRIKPHLPAAYNLARWLTHKDSDAEDVLQESLVRALRYFSDLKNEDAKAWLLQIVRNTCYSWLKKNRNFVELNDDVENQPQDGQRDPEGELLRKANATEVRLALNEMPVEFREILILRELEDYSYKEIAQIINISEGTVMSRLSRARSKFRESLSGVKKGAH